VFILKVNIHMPSIKNIEGVFTNVVAVAVQSAFHLEIY
jgi:hypothetical protein